MNIEAYRDYCLAKPGVTEGFPFDDVVLVFKVLGKIFAFCDVNTFEGISLKCDPERALDLRAQHPAITGGYHLSKKHWNTLAMDGSLDESLIKELINHSYELVLASLPKKAQKELSES